MDIIVVKAKQLKHNTNKPGPELSRVLTMWRRRVQVLYHISLNHLFLPQVNRRTASYRTNKILKFVMQSLQGVKNDR